MNPWQDKGGACYPGTRNLDFLEQMMHLRLPVGLRMPLPLASAVPDRLGHRTPIWANEIHSAPGLCKGPVECGDGSIEKSRVLEEIKDEKPYSKMRESKK